MTPNAQRKRCSPRRSGLFDWPRSPRSEVSAGDSLWRGWPGRAYGALKPTHGFTLIDLLVTITIIAVVAAIVVPALMDQDRSRLMAGAVLLASDLELAQVMTISNPRQPVVVRFKPAEAKYWLAYAATPCVPIPRNESGEPYLVIFGQGRASTAAGVSMSVDQIAGDTLTFLPQGGLADFTAQPTITLTIDERWVTLAIAPTTGTISETAGSS